MEEETRANRVMKVITDFIQMILNFSLVVAALLLCYLLLHEIYLIFRLATDLHANVHEILQEILVFFLYFGFVSMIVKYFKENYHFPLRYLLYIGITATIRFIIVNRDNASQNLILSLVVLLLLFGYIMLAKLRIRQ